MSYTSVAELSGRTYNQLLSSVQAIVYMLYYYHHLVRPCIADIPMSEMSGRSGSIHQLISVDWFLRQLCLQ